MVRLAIISGDFRVNLWPIKRCELELACCNKRPILSESEYLLDTIVLKGTVDRACLPKRDGFELAVLFRKLHHDSSQSSRTGCAVLHFVQA